MADEDHSPAFWTSVATTFKSDPAVIFDLFGEPHVGTETPTNADWSCWLTGSANGSVASCPATFTPAGSTTTVSYATAGMQQLVTTVRATGASQPIMVGGLNWSGDPCGLNDSGGNYGICMEIANMPTDLDKQLAISMHTYGPHDGPSGSTICTTSTCWNEVYADAKAASLPLITGEFGEMDCSHAYIDSYMNWADTNNVSYVAWSWEKNYGTTCDPLQLLSSYDGTPSPNSPEAADYMAHLLSLSP
jgi:hypothetical protein